MKRTKIHLPNFLFYDRTGIEAFLEKQARKGWLLEGISLLHWKFRRIEPQPLHFAVTYFPKASQFAPGPTEAEETYRDYCACSGWHLAAASGQMQIFYSEEPDPVPIETDPELELENIHKSVRKTYLVAQALMLLVWLMGLGEMKKVFDYFPLEFFSDGANLRRTAVYLLLIGMDLAEIIRYFCWYRKARRAARETGQFIETRGFGKLWAAMMGLILLNWLVTLVSAGPDRLVLAVVLAAMMVVLIWLSWKLSALLRKRGFPRWKNILCTVVMTYGLSVAFLLGANAMVEAWPWQPETEAVPPLLVSDLTGEDGGTYTTEWYSHESFLLGYHVGRQQADALPEIEYAVTEVKWPQSYDWCLEAQFILGPQRRVTVDPAPWGAETVYRRCRGQELLNQYVICYPDRIVALELDWEPTQAQMGIIGKVLGEEEIK